MLDRRGWFNAGLGQSLWRVQTRSTDDLWMLFVSHAHSLSLLLTLVHRSSVNLVCVVSPSLCIVRYVEMRYTDNLWILPVCFSVLMAIFLSLSTDHLWMWLRKSSQTNSVCVDYFVLSQMNFVCDEEKHHKDGKSTQTTSTDHLWISSVHTIRIGLIYLQVDRPADRWIKSGTQMSTNRKFCGSQICRSKYQKTRQMSRQTDSKFGFPGHPIGCSLSLINKGTKLYVITDIFGTS